MISKAIVKDGGLFIHSVGDGLIVRLSKDLIREFPEMKGFSKRNLEIHEKIVSLL